MLSNHEMQIARLLTSKVELFRNFAKYYLKELDFVEVIEFWDDVDYTADNPAFGHNENHNGLLKIRFKSDQKLRDRVLFIRFFYKGYPFCDCQKVKVGKKWKRNLNTSNRCEYCHFDGKLGVIKCEFTNSRRDIEVSPPQWFNTTESLIEAIKQYYACLQYLAFLSLRP